MQIESGITHAIVTGAASGLGRASAYALADAGAQVTVFDLNEEAGRAVATDIGGQFCRVDVCLLYTSPSPRDLSTSRMPSSA